MCLPFSRASKLAKCDAWDAWKDRGKSSHKNISCYKFCTWRKGVWLARSWFGLLVAFKTMIKTQDVIDVIG